MAGEEHQYQSMAEQAAAIAQRVMAEQRAAKRNIKVPVVGSQGKIVDASPHLAAKYNSQQMAILWAQVNEHPERYIKDPKPGYHYGFVGMKDLAGIARIRSGKRYMKMTPADMREDSDLPWSTHKAPTGEMVLIYDCYMVGIPPKTWEEDYVYREHRAIATLAGIQDNFMAGVESSGGQDGALDVKVHKPGTV